MIVKLKNKKIGEDNPCFIIAEAGVVHNGDFEMAKELVSIAAKSKADAVTFQHIVGERLNSSEVETKLTTADWKKWELSDEQLKELSVMARDAGLLFSICVTDEKSLDLVMDIGIDFIKIVSGDMTHHPFLEKCSSTGLPIFMSTGCSSLEEVKEAIEVIEKGKSKVVIYHTNSSYPTPPEEVNLRIMETLGEEFDYPIGFCDHSVEAMTSVIAAARGAKVVEKHFTTKRELGGPDSEVSLEPDELYRMVDDIRFAEMVLGTPGRRLLKCEIDMAKLARRSITSRVRIDKGRTITKEMLTIKRPGTGIRPKDLSKVIGKKAKKDIPVDVLIKEEWLE